MYSVENISMKNNSCCGIFIPIVEDVVENRVFSNDICIDKDTNSIWVSQEFSFIKLQRDGNLEDFNEWLRESFKNNHSCVKGLLKKISAKGV